MLVLHIVPPAAINESAKRPALRNELTVINQSAPCDMQDLKLTPTNGCIFSSGTLNKFIVDLLTFYSL